MGMIAHPSGFVRQGIFRMVAQEADTRRMIRRVSVRPDYCLVNCSRGPNAYFRLFFTSRAPPWYARLVAFCF